MSSTSKMLQGALKYHTDIWKLQKIILLIVKKCALNWTRCFNVADNMRQLLNKSPEIKPRDIGNRSEDVKSEHW